MTEITRLLRQKTVLCARAFEHTRDLNEAYLIVHGVMTKALRSVGSMQPDLGRAMTVALDARARSLA